MPENDTDKNLIILGIVALGLGLGFLAYLAYINKKQQSTQVLHGLYNPQQIPEEVQPMQMFRNQEQIIKNQEQVLKQSELEILNLRHQLETFQSINVKDTNTEISEKPSINKSFVQKRDDTRENKLRQDMFGMI